MTTETTQTRAETRPALAAGLTSSLADFAAARTDEPAWLRQARDESAAAFRDQGFPTRKQEAWRNTDVRALAEAPLAPMPAGDPEAVRAAVDAVRCGGARVVLLNGRHCAALSDPLPAGVRVESIADALREHPEELRAPITGEGAADGPFAALNTAFLEDGLRIRVAANAAPGAPVEVVFAWSSVEPDDAAADRPGATAAHPRLLVDLAEGAEATLVETHLDPGGPALVNALVDVRVADGARLRHVRVADAQPRAHHVVDTRVDQGRDSHYASTIVTFGGRVMRSDLTVRLGGEGAHAELDGLYVLDDARHVDHHTIVDHAVARTTSREHYKGILGGRARGAFLGRIVVRPDAQHIHAEQQNNNLLASDEALVNSTPQLEIHADDVQCAHGSTVGQIDPTALFYLRSRGISEAHARELLTRAFASEILERVPVEPLRRRLSARLTSDPQSEHLEVDE